MCYLFIVISGLLGPKRLQRARLIGVLELIRKIGASKEQSRREREAEERESGIERGVDDDDDMDL